MVHVLVNQRGHIKNACGIKSHSTGKWLFVCYRSLSAGANRSDVNSIMCCACRIKNIGCLLKFLPKLIYYSPSYFCNTWHLLEDFSEGHAYIIVCQEKSVIDGYWLDWWLITCKMSCLPSNPHYYLLQSQTVSPLIILPNLTTPVLGIHH